MVPTPVKITIDQSPNQIISISPGKKEDSLRYKNYYFSGHQIIKPNNAFVLIMGNPSKLHCIKLVIAPAPPPKKKGPISWANHWYFFSFMGQQRKKKQGPYFSPHKKPTGTEPSY